LYSISTLSITTVLATPGPLIRCLGMADKAISM
jgi:hypothetical protein